MSGSEPEEPLGADEAALIEAAVTERTEQVREDMVRAGDQDALATLGAFASMSRENLEFDLRDLKARVARAIAGIEVSPYLSETDDPSIAARSVVELARRIVRDLVIAGVPVIEEPTAAQTAGFVVWPVVERSEPDDEVVVEWQHHPGAELLLGDDELLQLSAAADRYVIETLRLLGYVVSDGSGVVTVTGEHR